MSNYAHTFTRPQFINFKPCLSTRKLWNVKQPPTWSISAFSVVHFHLNFVLLLMNFLIKYFPTPYEFQSCKVVELNTTKCVFSRNGIFYEKFPLKRTLFGYLMTLFAINLDHKIGNEVFILLHSASRDVKLEEMKKRKLHIYFFPFLLKSRRKKWREGRSTLFVCCLGKKVY